MTELLRRFTIRARMNGAIAMVLLLFGLVGLTGLLGGSHLVELNSHFMQHSVAEMRNVATMQQQLGEVRRYEKDVVIHYEKAAEVDKAMLAWRDALVATEQAMNNILRGEEDEDNPLARKAIAALTDYAKACAPVFRQTRNGAFDNATAVNRQLERAKEHVHLAEQMVAGIDEIIRKEAEVTRGEFIDTMRTVLWAFAAVLGVTVLVVVPLTLANARSITAPLAEAESAARAIAQGDLARPIRDDGRDEVGAMLRGLSEMQRALQHVVSQVRQASDLIRTSSAEVASGNADLSNRTENAASSLQQTASSIEQLTGNVRQSAEAASQANQLAASAAESARRGGSVVHEVVANMSDISDSSRRIADIIGTIDGIAFQTNILALNAAVEAARAGEQGRGFAVVAGEVRSLAQRSAAAAREIKSLISSSVDKVESGAGLVRQAGTVMEDIVAGVQRVTDVMGEISAASHEQSQGIGQVNAAVADLDQMTQRNAALVEQSTAAAESLREQAQRLADVVGTFRLEPAAA
jgi:methyl-accepting chemotaxis protein